MLTMRMLTMRMLSLGLFVLFGIVAVNADAGVAVYPLRAEYAQESPQPIQPISVVNGTNKRVRIQVSLADWFLQKDGTPVFIEPKLNAKPMRWSARTWIHVNPTEFELAPGERQSVRWSIRPPAPSTPDAPPLKAGGYRAAILFTLLPPLVFGEAPPPEQIRNRIATVVYYTVGHPKPEGRLTGMEIAERDDGLEAAISIKNTGSVHYRLRGRAAVISAEGQSVVESTFSSIPVLPESERRFKLHLPGRLKPGKYTLVVRVDIGREEILVGKKRFTVQPTAPGPSPR